MHEWAAGFIFAGRLSAGCMVVAVSNAPAGFTDSGEQASPKILLRVTDLKVSIPICSNHQVHPVDGVSFQLAEGEAVGVLGESGAGKTTLARSLMRLLPPSSRVQGLIEFDGVPLLALGEKALRSVRGNRISLVHQDSSGLNNPVRRVGEQLVDVLRAHRPWSGQRCREEAFSLLRQMDLKCVTRIYSAYPHQLSGGEQQRIVVALALICQPSLVIADEPTASVDRDTASQILRLFKHRKESLRGSTIIISHDVGVLAQVADTIMVMCEGRIVEQGSVERVLNQPTHPYTCALLRCSDLGKFDPRHRTAKSVRLTTMEAPAKPRNAQVRPVALDSIVKRPKVPKSPWLLQAVGLSKSYSHGFLWRNNRQVKALDNANISLPKGKTVAVVGKSGSGKSTLAMCLALLEKPDAGEIIFEGCRVHTLGRADLRAVRRQIQIIFQDSTMALSPRLTTTQLVEEPLKIQRSVPAHERSQLVSKLLEQVGLTKEHYRRRPLRTQRGRAASSV